jgi:hypothetical protein
MDFSKYPKHSSTAFFNKYIEEFKKEMAARNKALKTSSTHKTKGNLSRQNNFLPLSAKSKSSKKKWRLSNPDPQSSSFQIKPEVR